MRKVERLVDDAEEEEDAVEEAVAAEDRADGVDLDDVAHHQRDDEDERHARISAGLRRLASR